MTMTTQNPAEGENTLPAIVILTHGEFGKGLVGSAAMIFGSDAYTNMHVACLGEQESPDDYMERVGEIFNSLPEDSLYFVDVFGGTPFNTLVKLSRERIPYAIAGVSMPILLEALGLRQFLSGQELKEKVLEGAQDGIVDITSILNAQFGPK